MDKWQPPIPKPETWKITNAPLVVRLSPAPTGAKRMTIDEGMRIQIDPNDTCRLHLAEYKYIRLVKVGNFVADEPLYVVIERVQAQDDDRGKVIAAYLR